MHTNKGGMIVASKRDIPAFVQRKTAKPEMIEPEPTYNLSHSQSQPIMPISTQGDFGMPSNGHHGNMTRRPKLPTPKSKLRVKAGNMLYKSVPDGNPKVENLPDMPKYYNHNFPIQAVLSYGK